MNTFNRILVILLDLLLLIGAIVVLLVTFGVVTPANVLPAGSTQTAFGQWLGSFATMPPDATLITAVVSVLIILAGLALLAAELRPKPRMQTIAIRNDGLGSVTVRTESVRELISYTAAQIPEVLQLQPRLEQGSQGLQIRCRASLTPGANVAEVSTELQSRIKDAVEQYLGMNVASVAVQAQLAPLAGVDSAAPRPRRQLR